MVSVFIDSSALYSLLDQYDKNHSRAVELWKVFAANTGWCPPVLVELADLDVRLGEPDKTPERLRQAIEILEVIGDGKGISRCQELLAQATRAQVTNGAITP